MDDENDETEDVDEEQEDKEPEVEVFDGDVIAPQLTQYPYTKKGKKAPYRALTIPERDMLFAFYEKWNGNMIAMSRDVECRFKAYSQIKYYAALYHFAEQYTHIKTKRAIETISGLKDSKILAIERAAEMLKPRQMPFLDSKTREPILDLEGQPMFYTLYPDQKTVKTAYEIIKTELGEPTFIAKSEIMTPQTDEMKAAMDKLAQLTTHAKQPRDNGNTVQGEREAAEDTTTVSTALPDDPDTQSSAQ